MPPSALWYLRMHLAFLLVVCLPAGMYGQLEKGQFNCGQNLTVADTQLQVSSGAAAVCTDPLQTRYISVAIHWLLPDEMVRFSFWDGCSSPQKQFAYFGPGNFTETSDGYRNRSTNGYERAEHIITQANAELANIAVQWRKNPASFYPDSVAEIPFQYVLKGTYFHRNTKAYSLELSMDSIQNLYDIDSNLVLDIYFTPAMGYSYVSWSGNAFLPGSGDKFVIVRDGYLSYLSEGCREWSLTYSAFIVNHEVSHCLNLFHTWNGDDACNDTPFGCAYQRIKGSACTTVNANCWRYGSNGNPCPGHQDPCWEWSCISNNLMDYNEYSPHALTPCQLSRIYENLTKGTGITYVHSCDGCAPPNAFFSLPDSIMLCAKQNGIYLNASGSWGEDMYQFRICEVDSLDSTACAFGSIFETGWLQGQAGIMPLHKLYPFESEKTYLVSLEVNQSACTKPHQFSRKFKVLACGSTPDPWCCFERSIQNPINQSGLFTFAMPESGTVQIRAVHLVSGRRYELVREAEFAEGAQEIELQTQGLPKGSYILETVVNGRLFHDHLIKI